VFAGDIRGIEKIEKVEDRGARKWPMRVAMVILNLVDFYNSL